MFEAFVLVCLIGTNNVCHTLEDLGGPYKTEKQCTTRAYEIAMEDRIITEEERKFLKLQAKTLGLDQERIDYIESWYNSNLENEEE